MPTLNPHLIPPIEALPAVAPPTLVDSSVLASYDCAIGGLGFRYAQDANRPLMWDTMPYNITPYSKANQLDTAANPGENSIGYWSIRYQSSFHGGGGNLYMERPDIPEADTEIRFDQSKNLDVLTIPGRAIRLPDTTLATADTTSHIAPVNVGGLDRAVYTDATGKVKLLDPYTPTVQQFTTVTDACTSVVSNGQYAFAVSPTAGSVWKVDPTNIASGTKIATFTPTTVANLGWVKGRLMLGAANLVYEVDSTVSSPVNLVTATPSPLRYTHPAPGWNWRCFAESPSSILVAGDAGSHSEVAEFAILTQSGIPTLQVADTALTMPPGEQILCMLNEMASYLAVGTSKGVRVCEFGDSYSASDLTAGPLTLPLTETQFSVASLAARDRFFFAAGLAVDEPGLVRIDLATRTDSAGRFAYATDLIAPVKQAAQTVTAVTALPSGRLVFSVPGYGICVEGVGPGSVREAWVRTSRIRYNTTEPKIFKQGYVRGDFSNGQVTVTADTSTGAQGISVIGDVTGDPDPFGLPDGKAEWITLTFNLTGTTTILNAYGIKALPGQKQQRLITLTLACLDRETDRLGHEHIDFGSARNRLEALYALAEGGDIQIFQEFSLFGERNTEVVIRRVTYEQTARPTPISDFGGDVTVQLATVV